MSTLQFLIIAINLNILLLGVIFFMLKKGNALANKLKGLFLIASAYITFSMATLEDIALFPYLIRVYEPVSLLLLPSLFVYFSKLIYEEDFMKHGDWLHFMPSILSLVLLMPFLVKSNSYKLTWLENSIQDYHYYKIWNFIYLTQLLIYSFLFVLKIRYFHCHPDKKRDKSRMVKQQIINFIILFLGIFTIGIVLMIVLIPKLYFLAIPIQVFVIHEIYKLIKSSRMIDTVYSSTVSNHIQCKNLDKLIHYLTTTDHYFIPELTLEHVSRETGFKMHEISRYINESMCMNFNNFINKKRIEEAKHRLNDPVYQHHSLEGIGQSVGFKSKTTFYRAFKKFTGKTPGEFSYITKKQMLSTTGIKN